ncbi:MAG: hypothetical protein GQ565_06315 [Candidatus Aegiribacteria sp.]|nr:hypothetical protein [Candidatus Aegiribacteria sp.]
MEIQSVKPVENSVDPEMEVKIRIDGFESDEYIIDISGEVRTDNILLSRVVFMPEKLNNDYRITPKYNYPSSRYRKHSCVVFRLSQKALAAIQNSRENNPKTDIELAFNLTFRSVRGEFGATDHKTGEKRLLTVGPNQQEVIVYQHRNQEIMHSIPASDWVHDFAPAFGIGSFQLIEWHIPDTVSIGNDETELLQRMLECLDSMREAFCDCDWQRIMELSRRYSELIRKEDLIKEIFTKSGITEDVYTLLDSGFNTFYQYFSKYIHEKSKDQTIKQMPVACREDAELAYILSMNIFNMISRKLKRAKND